MDIQSDEDIPVEKRKHLKPSILKSNCPKDKQVSGKLTHLRVPHSDKHAGIFTSARQSST